MSIRAEGQYSLAALSGLFDRVKGESENRANRAVILDVSRVVGTIPVMDMFTLAEHCSKVWKLTLKIALISPEVRLYSFFENVARNRGVQISVVPNQGAAMEWLASH